MGPSLYRRYFLNTLLNSGYALASLVLLLIALISPKVAFATDAVPPWMVRVESTYQCDLAIVSTPCKAAIHGVGFLIYIPAKVELDNKAHYLVMTDAHLSHGNYGSNSLKLFYRYGNRWLSVNPIFNGNELVRLSDNLNDIDIIEIEQPKEIPNESMFQYNYNIESPRESYFWVKDEISGKGYNEVYVAENVFAVAPPALANKPEAYKKNSYAISGASLSEINRTQHELVKGLNITSFGAEFITQSQIVGGMSGSPLLKKMSGELVVLGLSKRYHRYFNTSYFSTLSQLSELLLNFGERYYFASSKTDVVEPFSWSFIPFIGTFVQDIRKGISEFSYISSNSGTFEIQNSGGHDSADGGGGHDTSDGGDWDSKVKAQIQSMPGMMFLNKHILGFSVTIPSLSNGLKTSEETSINAYGNFEAIGFITATKELIKKQYGKDIQIGYIDAEADLKELLKNKIKNFPELRDPLSLDRELEKHYFKNKMQKDLLDNYGRETGKSSADFTGIPLCLINKASIDRLGGKTGKETIEMALLRTSQIDHSNPSQALKSYYIMEVPLDLVWKKGVSTGSHRDKNVSLKEDVIYDTKGLFFVNVADPICRSANCPFLFSLNKTPYISLKWREESESKIANCFLLNNDDFFKNPNLKRLTSEDL